MQQDQLFIEVDGVYQEADLPNLEIATNKQSFDATDVSSRFDDYTQEIGLPNTPANNKIFKHANDFSTYSDIQDIRMNCIYLVGGSGIFGLGSYIRVLSISDLEYKCQIVGGSAELISGLKSKNEDGKQKTLNDLSWTEEITLSYNTWADLTTSKSQTAFYALTDFDKASNGNYSFNAEQNYIVADNQKPYIWYRDVLNKMFSEFGYTLETDIQDDDLDYMAMQFASIKEDVETITLENGTGLTPVNLITYNTINGTTGNLPISIDVDMAGSLRVNTEESQYTTGSVGSFNGLKYTALSPAVYVFNIDFDIASNIKNVPADSRILSRYINASQSVSVYVNGEIRENYIVSKESNTAGYSFDGSGGELRSTRGNGGGRGTSVSVSSSGRLRNIIDEPISLTLDSGDEVVFVIKNYISDDYDGDEDLSIVYLDTAITKFNINLINVRPRVGVALMGTDIKIKNNLPNIKLIDFFLSFLKMFCGLLFVDNYTKTVYVYNFTVVPDSKSIALDWSDKLVKMTGLINNKPPYAKKNIIKYKDTPRDVNDDGFVTINETVAEKLFGDGIVIYYYEDEAAYISGDYEYVTNATDASFPSGKYRYQTLPTVIEEDDITTIDEGFLFVNNEDLEEEKTLIELPFEAVEVFKGTDKNGTAFSYAKFRDCEENVLREYQTPRLVTINGDVVFDIKSSEGADRTSVSVPYASSVNNDRDIKMSTIVSKYFSGFNNSVLTDFRRIEDVVFDLNETDIQTFSPYVPIYLEKYGAYFYVNKIKDYMKDKLTKVDLIKI